MSLEGDVSSILEGLRRMEKGADVAAGMKALRAGGQVLAQAMKSRIRKKSGRTERSIGVRRAKRIGDDIAGVQVGASGDRAHVGRLLETGYLRKNKRTGAVHHIPAYPWARPAFDSTRGAVKATVFATLRSEISKAAEGAR